MGNKESTEPVKCDEAQGRQTKKSTTGKKNKERTFMEHKGVKNTTKKDGSKTEQLSTKDKSIDDNTRLAFEDWLYKRLTKYFTDIKHNVLDPRNDKDERSEIESAVSEFLDFLFKETEIVDRRFRINIQDIIGVGAFHENLEIVAAERLEFCVVIDELSKDNIGFINKVSEDGNEILRVNVIENCARRWEECVLSEGLDKYWLLSDRGIVPTFVDRVLKAVNNVRSKSRASIYRNHGRLDLLQENCVKKEKSSVEIKFAWNKDSIITVSLTPCLRYDDVFQFINENTTPNQRVINILNSEKKLLLQPIPETADHFQWHFGHVEKALMKENSLRIHNSVYQLVTFFVQGYNQAVVTKTEIFTNEVIKTLVLFHHDKCQAKNRLADCVMSVIDDMRKLLKAFLGDKPIMVLQNYFYQQQNVLPRTCRYADKSAIQINLAGLEQLVNHLINEIGCTPLYDFNKDIKSMIPVNAFILQEDYRAKKKADDKTDDSVEAKKTLINAVSKKKFTVQF